MNSWIGKAANALTRQHRQWRRARNLRTGRAAPGPRVPWGVAAACGVAVAGALLLAGHARHLSAVAAPAGAPQGPGTHAAINALQAIVPGWAFEVPAGAGVSVVRGEGAVLLIVAGMQAAPPVHIDLCRQRRASGRMLPVRIGYQFDELARLAKQKIDVNAAVLAAPDSSMPHLQVSGNASAQFLPLSVAWPRQQARWVSDTGGATMQREGWLIWKEAAIRVLRRASRHCQSAGELVIESYRQAQAPSRLAHVIGLSRHGKGVSAFLPGGRYLVPVAATARLEDQALFQQLRDGGLLRLTRYGMAEVAPRDLALWQESSVEGRADVLRDWPQLATNADLEALFKRLYRKADGAYVREQVRIFNNERRLLAWRVRPSLADAPMQVTVGGAPVPTAEQLPLAAARLFAHVPQGWAPWQRAAAWPADGIEDAAQLTVHLPQSRTGQVDMLVVGRVLTVDGARLVSAQDMCSGRACRSRSSVQQIVLQVAPKARRISMKVVPLAASALGDGIDQYRHLHVDNGQLAWRSLDAGSAMARAEEPAGVVLQDRHGSLLWSGGAPAQATLKAGLAPLLGLRAGHAASVAGMLARLPAPDGQPHAARLSLDLALQQASHNALDCVGLRQGKWDGAACNGALAVPPGRQAGMVILDTDSGDILAAAGVGGTVVGADNWSEVRDFDRVNPDRSPLRLPALQHDGGTHRSPGSTFKIIGALGLELAAQQNPQVAALLGAMPLPAMNQLAARQGYDFRTAAASYPVTAGQARITNYRDGHLDRRARDGRLGLSEALTYSLNTWFAWAGELSDRSLFGRAEGGAPDMQAIEPGALDSVRPIVAMAHKVGFERELRLDGGLLPADFRWQQWDALQPSQARIDPIHTRHELRQMAIGLRMQATPLHMAMVAGAVGQGRAIVPRLLLALNGEAASQTDGSQLDVRLDRIRAGMKGVVDEGTAAGAFANPQLASIRRGLSGKTGTSPAMVTTASGRQRELATVWFAGWLEPHSIAGEKRRLALAVFISHSDSSGGEHAAPVVASVLSAMAALKPEQRGK